MPRVRIELTTPASSGQRSTTELPRLSYALINIKAAEERVCAEILLLALPKLESYLSEGGSYGGFLCDLPLCNLSVHQELTIFQSSISPTFALWARADSNG